MTPDAIREQLEKILSSAAFSTAGRHSRLLRYLVERTLAGEGEHLKEYVLGTEVFDRADSYDPRLDSIVRVEARRLRSRLEEYYNHEGANDQVLVAIPRGNYVPLFSPRLGAAPDPPAVVGKGRPYSTLAIIAAALSAAIALVAAAVALNGNRQPAQASTGPGIAVLPFEHFSADQSEARRAAELTDAVTSELARLGTVSVASRTSAGQYTGERRPIRDIASALDVTFVIEASAVRDGESVRIVVRLVDARLDRKVWVGEYEMGPNDLRHVARRIASEAAAAALK